MAEGPDRRAFEVLTAPHGPDTAEFREIAQTVAAVDTLEAFLRDLRARYPETGSFTPVDARRPAPGAAVAGAGRGAGHDRLGAAEAEGARGGQVNAAVRIVTAT